MPIGFRIEPGEGRWEVFTQATRAERPDPGKAAQGVQANIQRFGAPHRKSRDGAGVALLRDPIGFLNFRDDFSEQGFAELIVVTLAEVRVAQAWSSWRNDLRRAIAERHDDEHRFRFPLRDQVIENHVSAPHGGPAARVIAETVKEVQDRVQLVGFGIVAGRRIDEIVSFIAHHARFIEVMVNRAVGHIVHLPR